MNVQHYKYTGPDGFVFERTDSPQEHGTWVPSAMVLQLERTIAELTKQRDRWYEAAGQRQDELNNVKPSRAAR